VRAQAETFERLCAGQLHETFGPAPGEDPIAHHLGVLADKTGALIATSARLGAMLAGCEPVVVEAVVAFGEKAGVAFQLADDLIDLISDGAVSGKTPGTDLREHVPTMPQLLVERRARADRAAGRMDTSAVALSRAMAQDLSSDTRLAEVVAALTKDPAMEQARGVARQWSEDAVAELSPLPEGPVKAALSAFADVMVARLA
jgi:heptaprenyl diphosphate synthase